MVRAVIADLKDDPVALEELRMLLGAMVEPQPASSAPAYTVKSLAAELGRTPRSIRGAIERGELEAAKRGRGFLISAEAVSRWASTPLEATARSSRRPHPTRARPTTGPMRTALGGR